MPGPGLCNVFFLFSAIEKVVLRDRVPIVQAGEFQKLLIEYFLNIKVYYQVKVVLFPQKKATTET